MGMTLVYIDEPAPRERHREAAPDGAVFAQARIPAVDADADKVIIGTPDPDHDVKAHRDWAKVKQKYEAEKKYRDSDVSPHLEVEVRSEMDPDFSGGEDALEELVGMRQANALNDAGYGTVQAARALPKDDLVELDGVGEGTYESLHQDEE